MSTSDFIRGRRRDAWAFGRGLRDELLGDYCREHSLDAPPPPALVVDELIRDFLEFELNFDPLPLNVFAQATFDGGHTVIKVNNLTGKIRGVKDARGVQNVAKWHETIHGISDAPPESRGQAMFTGFDAPNTSPAIDHPRTSRVPTRPRSSGPKKRAARLPFLIRICVD